MARAGLTVDVEPDWGISGTRAFREIAPRFLRFLEQRAIRATFFVVGELVNADASLVAALAERNEVASHGLTHRPLSGLTADELQRELRESKMRLEQLKVKVDGFRAPFFRRPPAWLSKVKRAGYRYDASIGSVMPGRVNGRLDRLPCPHRKGGIYEFPTSAMCHGMLPFSLTYLRLTYPLSLRCLPRVPSMLYIHFHEFLPADSASVLPGPLRAVLSHNCGEKAWEILNRALDAISCEFMTCREMLEEAGANR